MNKPSAAHGRTTSGPSAGERVLDVHIDEATLAVDLVDGRTITVPVTWFPRLVAATAKQRKNWRVSAGGFGIHWPDLDEDLGVEGLLRGAPAAAARPAKRRGA